MKDLSKDPDPELNTIEEWVEMELQSLWHELYEAHRWTVGNDGYPWRSGSWSMKCDAIAVRISAPSWAVMT